MCTEQCGRCFLEPGGRGGNEDITRSVVGLDQGHLYELLLREGRQCYWCSKLER